MGEAARLGDPIVHTSALAGFLTGAVIGIALIAAVAFATFTCGFGVALLAGLAAGIGASAILGLGEAIGRMFSSPSGAIDSGSLNVFINGKKAAYAKASTVTCSKHNPTPMVAEGSGNVFYNSLPAARKGDAITCGAKIDAGSPNTFVGGGTVRYMKVDDEVPEWLRTTVDWAFALAGLVGGLAGLLKAAGGFSRAMLPCAAKFIGGFVIGEAVGRAVIGPAVQRVFGGQQGYPVDVTTGRKLLLASDEVDFVLQSPLPLEIGRFYASNLTRVGALGKGWVLPWELRLERRGGHIWLIDAQGRESGFPMVLPGHSAFSDVEQTYLSCTVDGRYILHDLNERYFDFGPLELGAADDSAALKRIEDPSGQWLEFERAGTTGPVRRITSSGGQQLRLSYLQMQGRLTDIELVHQQKRHTVVRYGYDAEGHLASVTDARGQVVRRFEYADGLMSAHSNALGFTCRYEWQAVGDAPRVVQASTSEGEQSTFTYDLQNRRTRVVDELGRTAEWAYDAHFQVVECVDLDGKRYRTEYSEAGQPTVLHLPPQELADAAPDAQAQVEEGQEGSAERAKAMARKVIFEYDEAARIIAETDVLGRTTSTRYDGRSMRPLAIQFPDGSQWKAEYDAVGRLLKTVDPLGHEERYEYPQGTLAPRPRTHVDAKGGEKTLQWNKSGQLIAFTDCSGKTTRYEYDEYGGLTSATNALEQTTRIQRQPTGQPLTIELPDGGQERFEYDAAGLLVHHQDRAGHTRRWQRNARGQVVQSTDPVGRTLDYRYDPQGRLVELKSATGAYAFRYDNGDRLTEELRPDGMRREFTHGAFGQTLALVENGTVGLEGTQAEGLVRVTQFQRDKAARLLRTEDNSSTTDYSWDDGDRLLEARKTPTAPGQSAGVVASTVAFKYDKAGRLLSEKGCDGSVTYELDELGNLTGLGLPQEQHIGFLHYGSGHVHQVRYGEQVVADIERDDLHREVLRTQGRLTLGRGYDALGRRTWESAANTQAPNAPGPIAGQGKLWRTYRYSAEGELAEQSDNLRGAWRFQYDPAGQLTRKARPDVLAGLEQFAWDAAGNLLDDIQKRSAGRVEGNRLTMWQDIHFGYDAWGNLVTKRSGNRQTQRFSYDAQNRLLGVRTEAAGGVVQTLFEYDALGRRIGKTVRHTEASGLAHQAERRRFVWQGLRMVQELRDSGLSNYIYGDSPYTPMARVDAPMGVQEKARVYHFHTDLVGAPLEVTDGDGELAWAGTYAAWGKVQEAGDLALESRIDQPLRFAGQYADESTGLHYNTFRYYDPDVGRFISQDPIGLAGGENLYAYAPNPTGWVDPWGWCAVALGKNMKAAGIKRPANTTPHHIAGDTSQASLRGRNILAKHDIHPDDAVNGVFLPNRSNVDPAVPGILHNGRHPDAYVEAVNRRLGRADQMGGKTAVLDELKAIGQELSQAARNASWRDVL